MKRLIFARLPKIGTPKLQRFVVRLLPWKIIREVVGLVDSIHSTSVDIIKSRKMALEEGKEVMERQVGRGKDIYVRKFIVSTFGEDCQVIGIHYDHRIFTFAAVDTTSPWREPWILAQRQDAQEKLCLEICEARRISYDELMSLPYLDAVCKETLRLRVLITRILQVDIIVPSQLSSLWVPSLECKVHFSFTSQIAPFNYVRYRTRQDMVLPLGTPIKGVDGSEMHEISVPKGTNIFVNVTACNNDPSIWGEDSYEWKPERWLQPSPVFQVSFPTRKF